LSHFDETILIEAQKVPPKQAIKIFDAQAIKISTTAKATEAAIKAKLFSITQSVSMGVLQDVRDELSKAISEGKTFQSFQKDFKNTLARKGWSGERTILGAEGKEIAILTTPHRLKLIYSQNVQSALNAGRFERQIENADDRPFLELIDGILGAERSRPTHRAQSGSIQPITSRFWKSPNSWYPPNGFKCTGRTKSLTRAEAQSRGIKIKAPRARPDPGFGLNPATESFEPAREDFDDDIWEAGQEIEPAELT